MLICVTSFLMGRCDVLLFQRIKLAVDDNRRLMSTMLKFLTKSVTCPFPRPASPDLSHPTAPRRTSLPPLPPIPYPHWNTITAAKTPKPPYRSHTLPQLHCHISNKQGPSHKHVPRPLPQSQPQTYSDPDIASNRNHHS